MHISVPTDRMPGCACGASGYISPCCLVAATPHWATIADHCPVTLIKLVTCGIFLAPNIFVKEPISVGAVARFFNGNISTADSSS